jgi:hypothetical protein
LGSFRDSDITVRMSKPWYERRSPLNVEERLGFGTPLGQFAAAASPALG